MPTFQPCFLPLPSLAHSSPAGRPLALRSHSAAASAVTQQCALSSCPFTLFIFNTRAGLGPEESLSALSCCPFTLVNTSNGTPVHPTPTPRATDHGCQQPSALTQQLPVFITRIHTHPSIILPVFNTSNGTSGHHTTPPTMNCTTQLNCARAGLRVAGAHR